MPTPRCGASSAKLMAVTFFFLLSGAMAVGWSQEKAGGETAAAGSTVSPDEVVLTVGETKITAAAFEQIAAALPPQFQSVLATMGKKGFAEQFASLLSLAMEGEKRQLDQSEEFQRMVEFDRKVLLAQLTMNQIAQETGPVGAEEVNYYYQTHLPDFEQVKVTGIYLPFAPLKSGSLVTPQTLSAKPTYTEQQAQRKALELRVRIQSGQNMAALAKAESQHPTAAKGGDFGYISREQSQLAVPLVNAIFSLQPHQISAPLKDKSGYYIFRVEEKRTQPLEEIRQAIQTSLSMQKLNLRMETLKQSYLVSLNPSYFADSPATTPTKPPSSQTPRPR